MPSLSTVPASVPWRDELEELAERCFAIPAWWKGQARSVSEKVIHEPLWGSQRWRDWQVAIIDLPVVQRLRDIRQTSLAFMVYPGALHTRFDHSLGVASATKLFIGHLNSQSPPSISADEEAHAIAAALLHDIGHGPFSHLSEECYAFRPEWFSGILQSPTDADPVLYPRAAPHEALGALLLRTHAAATFFKALRKEFAVPTIDPIVLGDIIAGNGWDTHDHAAQLVNGELDADKADYIRRDAYYTGLAISLDIGRLSHTLRVVQDQQGVRQLALHRAGEAVGNQFLFAKTTLTSSLYHHAKVRAADATFKAIMERAISDGSDINGVTLDSPVAILELTDSDFFGLRFQSGDSETVRLVRKLQKRDLLYPAAVVSPQVVTGPSGLWNLRVSKNVWKNHEKISRARALSRSIAERVMNLEFCDVAVDFPYMVKLSSLPLTDGVTLESTLSSFPGEAWSEQYVEYLYRGYVFAPAEHGEIVAKEFRDLVADTYGTVLPESVYRPLSSYRD